jgi:predicted lipoprotein with Yx(FWY)xxD motif
MRKLLLVGPGLAAAAVVLAACGNSASPADPPASVPAVTTTGHANAGADSVAIKVAIKTVKTSKGTVLADSDGRTLYWFAKDTMSKSNCNGSCATYWPPVIGTPAAAAGTVLPHGFGTIKRADGQTQATYDGHPLYTYTGDTAAGQVSGNGLNVSGGLWWAVTPSGTALRKSPAPTSSSSSSSGSGGGW